MLPQVPELKQGHVELQPGLYKHYKGKMYRVLGVGYHTETMEQVVLYQSLYHDEQFGSNALWVRPLAMFLETVSVDGCTVPRFEYQGE